jgi:hypothetical protein
MDNTQLSNEHASEVLASDIEELSQIAVVALTPFAEMTPVQLSQNLAVREKAKKVVTLAGKIIDHVNAMLEHAEALNNITKTVHFHTNCRNPRIHAFKDGVAAIGDDGSVTADAILNSDFLYVADLHASYDPRQVTVCENVHIVLSSDELKRPSRLTFWSGGTYYLYYGNSLSLCNYLNRTTTLNLE